MILIVLSHARDIVHVRVLVLGRVSSLVRVHVRELVLDMESETAHVDEMEIDDNNLFVFLVTDLGTLERDSVVKVISNVIFLEGI